MRCLAIKTPTKSTFLHVQVVLKTYFPSISKNVNGRSIFPNCNAQLHSRVSNCGWRESNLIQRWSRRKLCITTILGGHCLLTRCSVCSGGWIVSWAQFFGANTFRMHEQTYLRWVAYLQQYLIALMVTQSITSMSQFPPLLKGFHSALDSGSPKSQV